MGCPAGSAVAARCRPRRRGGVCPTARGAGRSPLFFATGLGDEGGFAPEIDCPEDVLALLTKSILDAGHIPGRDGVAIALDPAASEFHRDGRYHVNGESLASNDLIERYARIVTDFPVWSIEDGLGETDTVGWQKLTAALGERVQLVGDDNFVTNPDLIAFARARGHRQRRVDQGQPGRHCLGNA